MKKLKVGMKVYDIWYPWLYGKIIKKLKTRIYISRNDGIVMYDKSHCQFLREE